MTCCELSLRNKGERVEGIKDVYVFVYSVDEWGEGESFKSG